MESQVRHVAPSASGVMTRQQPEQPPLKVAAGTGKAAGQPLGLPEDVVTLSSSESGPPGKKASQPVSSEERKALLQASSPGNGFSTYG